MKSRLAVTVTWNVEASAKLVKAVSDSGGVVPGHLTYPGETAGYEDLQHWQNHMGELALDVSYSFTMHEALPDLTEPGRANRRAKDLDRIAAQIGRLKTSLEDLDGKARRVKRSRGSPKEAEAHVRSDEVLVRRLDQALPVDFPGIIETVAALSDAVAEVRGQLGAVPPLPIQTAPPQAYLVQALAACYSKHFRTDPHLGLTKQYRNFGGPFPAFCRVALEIAGKPPMAEALTKMLQRHLLSSTDRQSEI